MGKELKEGVDRKNAGEWLKTKISFSHLCVCSWQSRMHGLRFLVWLRFIKRTFASIERIFLTRNTSRV